METFNIIQLFDLGGIVNSITFNYGNILASGE